LTQRLSPKYLEEHCLLPLEVTDDGCVVIASGTPLDQTVIDELSFVYERPVRLVAAPEAEIHTAILSTQAEAPMYASVSDMRDADLQILAPEDEALDDLQALASQAPVIQLVNLAILEALKRRASDVHIESTADGLRIRHRIDGVLHDAATHPRQYQAAVISRIKVMADLNIAERRIPQDGRVRLKLSDRELDLRVSTLPTVHGESVVLRILDRGGGARDLTELGMSDTTQVSFGRLVSRPHGIVLVTGPTGSGKTTTLYAALQHIDTPEVKIVTVEDPVEYQLDGMTQIPVNPKAGRNFATVLRSILRHDPDVIMVGEMRDRETAEIAIQAALTGHLVFSTLHTNDAPSGITRLLDMGVEPYLVAATVQGLLAQRLVRVICTGCAEPYTPTSEERRAATAAGVPAEQEDFKHGRGCEVCSETGYLGRTGAYELMTMSDGLRELVANRAPLDTIRAMARSQGLTPLHDAAWAKACAGITTCKEVVRVTRDDVI
jgi:general secretion pathway protein E